jgi:holo-[acyl-carrier protein] synthase
MPIVGHGIDLVDVSRIERMLIEHGERFRERCFTVGEIAAADASGRAAEFLAGRFAVKEAALKALGTGWSRGIAWTDVEVVTDNSGRPGVRVSGQAARIAESVGVARWWVSISHVGGHAVASVIAEGMGEGLGRRA